MSKIQICAINLLEFVPGTLVTVIVNGFCPDWLPPDDAMGPLDGVTDTDGVICVFFMDEDSNGSGNVFCSFAADKPNTISSNLRRLFSMPPVARGGASSTGYK